MRSQGSDREGGWGVKINPCPSKAVIFVLVILFFFSCKMFPDSNRHYSDGNPDKVYKLRLNPPSGGTYYYSITNESAFKMEVDDKKVDNRNTSTVGLSYKVNRDSAGDLLLDILYDKVHVKTNNRDNNEEEMDADNAAGSANQVEKLLGYLKGATIRVVLSPKGEMRSVTGYEAIKGKIMSGFQPDDTYSKTIAEQQWDQRIKAGLIQKNMEQLFKIFPDSEVHVGDKWRLHTEERDEVNMRISSVFTLTGTHDGVAVIRSEGDIRSQDSTGSAMGYNFAVSLKGKQEGQFELQMATGMVVSSSLESNIEGEMDMLGRKVPMTIHSKVEVLGRQVR